MAIQATLGQFDALASLYDYNYVPEDLTVREFRQTLEAQNGDTLIYVTFTEEFLALIDELIADPQFTDITISQLANAMAHFGMDAPLTRANIDAAIAAGPAPFKPAHESLIASFEAAVGYDIDTTKDDGGLFIEVGDKTYVNKVAGEIRSFLGILNRYNRTGEIEQNFVNNLFAYSIDTTSLVIQVYQFFTGKIPTKAGIEYLIDSEANPNDLTDLYYVPFNTENRYINLAASMGREGEGSAAFRAKYGDLSFRDAARALYDEIIGTDRAQAAGINVDAAIDYIVSQQAYFTAYGIDDIGAKAAVAGYLMERALAANVGRYNEAIRKYIGNVAQGEFAYDVDLFGAVVDDAPVETVGAAPLATEYGLA